MMADFTVKIRRYLLYPMLRPKLREFFFVFICAAVLAGVYIFVFADKNSAEFLNEEDIAKYIATSSVLNQSSAEHNKHTIAGLLVICANRPAAISNHLKQLLNLRPSKYQFPIIVSQDGNNEEVKRRVQSIPVKEGISFYRREREPTIRSRIYQYIAEHYKFALDKAFKDHKLDYVIVTEDDLDISKDFFSYFEWARIAMEADKTIWCASAWNDHGIPKLIDPKAPSQVWRTDFFPGLGWMLSKELWAELSTKWPAAYWDDWMRNSDVRKNRSCIRPEIPRTSHNMIMAGKGSSGGLYKSFLSSISNNKDPVDFALIPVDRILKSNFDSMLGQDIRESRDVPFDQFFSFKFDPQHSYRVTFSGIRSWQKLAKHIGLMLDIRGGMPRTAYYGIVTVMHQSCRLFILPEGYNMTDLTAWQYNPDWDKMVRYLEFAALYCKPTKFTGKCDPYSEEMKQWFKKRGQAKKLANWGEMIVV